MVVWPSLRRVCCHFQTIPVMLSPSAGVLPADGAQKALGASRAWWLVMFPSAALITTVLSVNFLGDGLRDALDPTQSIERR